MRGFIGGGRDPSRLDRGDDELIDAARDELETILDIKGPPLFSRLYRWPRQSPQYQVGHLDRVAAIDQRVASIPGVFLTGSGFRATGIPDCIADGRQIGTAAAQYVTRA
jgi:protoporphyrinogen/coproporphyrinogen III oxidase